nr:hypothetical protein CFP56_09553 [Quercus suber]
MPGDGSIGQVLTNASTDAQSLWSVYGCENETRTSSSLIGFYFLLAFLLRGASYLLRANDFASQPSEFRDSMHSTIFVLSSFSNSAYTMVVLCTGHEA